MRSVSRVGPNIDTGAHLPAIERCLDSLGDGDGAAVALAEVSDCLAGFLRDIGWSNAVDLHAIPTPATRGRECEEMAVEARRDESGLWLPVRLEAFSDRRSNAALYFWLAAVCGHLPRRSDAPDPLQRDLASLRAAMAMVTATLAETPGLTPLWHALAAAHVDQREDRALPDGEAAVEALVRSLLGDTVTLPPLATLFAALIGDGNLAAAIAPSGYRCYRPVPLWPDLRRPA